MALDFTAETIIVGSKGFQIWVKRNFDFYSYWLNFGCLIIRIHDIVYGRSQFLKFASQRNELILKNPTFYFNEILIDCVFY
jgi:hypothetical protein